MSMRAHQRAVDRRRATQAMTAYLYDDKPALDQVLAEADADPTGGSGSTGSSSA